MGRFIQLAHRGQLPELNVRLIAAFCASASITFTLSILAASPSSCDSDDLGAGIAACSSNCQSQRVTVANHRQFPFTNNQQSTIPPITIRPTVPQPFLSLDQTRIVPHPIHLISTTIPSSPHRPGHTWSVAG